MGKKESQRPEAAKVTVEDVEKAVWKAVEEKIATGEFHPKKEEETKWVNRHFLLTHLYHSSFSFIGIKICF